MEKQQSITIHNKSYKKIPAEKTNRQSLEDKLSIRQGVEKAIGEKIKATKPLQDSPALKEDMQISNLSSNLFVITKVKKLASYIITITNKSPKHFRPVFVNRMQNYCLDCLEALIQANSLRKDNKQSLQKRKEFQHQAYVKLKLLEYISFLAQENGCILQKQYEQITIQLAESINLLVAWRKSEEK